MATPETTPQPPVRMFRHHSMLIGLKRSGFHSHLRKSAARGKFPGWQIFLPQNLLPWLWNCTKYSFRRKHPFLAYPAHGDQGLYPLVSADGGPTIRLSIAGDWGTGTEEAYKVATLMNDSGPDYTVHLGDIYYVGDQSEVSQNCLGKATDGYEGVKWPKGKVGSFSMNGNHEMYANGDGYFDDLLPTLGIPGSRDRTQLTSFFCLENDVWRIIGLDTGYNSIGLPILGEIPFINQIPGIRATCKLEASMMNWLRTVVKPQERPRTTILLTHHQYFSAFEDVFPKPAKQLSEFFSGQELIWIWGHEHRFAIYEKYTPGAFSAYGRLVGNGALPVEIMTPKKPDEKALQYYDIRPYNAYKGVTVGYNGFVNLEINGNSARLDYRDVNNKKLVVEQFTVDGGKLSQRFEFVDESMTRGSAAPPELTAAAAH